MLSCNHNSSYPVSATYGYANIRHKYRAELKNSSHKVNNYTHEGIRGSAYMDSFGKSCHISGVFCVSNGIAAFFFM